MENKHKLKLVVFDLDNTLIRLDVDWPSARRELKSAFKKEYNQDFEFKPLNETIDKISGLLGPEARVLALDIIGKYEMASLPKSEPKKSVISLLRKLQEHANTAVFSTNTRKTVEESLKKHGIFDNIDYIVSADDVTKLKPNPEGLEGIIMHFKVRKGEVLYIGDKESDLASGKTAGVKTIVIGNST